VVTLLLIVDLRAVSGCVSSFDYHPVLVHLVDVVLEHITAREVGIEQLRGLALPVGHNTAPRILRMAVTLVRGWRILNVI